MNAGFWEMGGYAVYVWGSYGAGLAVFAWNVLAPLLERRALKRRLAVAAAQTASDTGARGSA
jgi:heme exporter protein CcmD